MSRQEDFFNEATKQMHEAVVPEYVNIPIGLAMKSINLT